MGVDQLVTGGDVDDPVVDSLTSDTVNTDELDSNIADYTDESPNRSIGTEYQNTTGHLIQISVQFEVPSSGDVINLGLLVGNSSGLNFDDHLADYIKRTADSSGNQATLTALVPDGAYYELAQFGSNSATIDQFNERGFE